MGHLIIITTINLYYFLFIGLSFGDDNKRPDNPYSIVRLLSTASAGP